MERFFVLGTVFVFETVFVFGTVFVFYIYSVQLPQQMLIAKGIS